MMEKQSQDPRWYQLLVLGGLLLYGLGWLDFELSCAQGLSILAGALGTQYAAARLAGLPSFDPKSALISSLSLCLLLRTNSLAIACLAGAVAVGSKFLIRWNGKHLFNPTNVSLVIMLVSGLGWVSSGQWGHGLFFGFLMACLGGVVVYRAMRSDVTYAFLCAYLILLFARARWLGDPLVIPLHQIENGALLLFAFFMISDPKTTPDSRAGRLWFGIAVAVGALFVQFGLFRPNALLWSLVGCTPLVPLLDRLLPGKRYAWNRPAAGAALEPQSVRCSLHHHKEVAMGFKIIGPLLFSLMLWSVTDASAFCGFYVAKADTKLFNKASEVAIVHHEDKTVITMKNDFKGEVKEFAMVIPVPTVLTREQIHVGDAALLEHLDAYSSPRLVEYFDTNPCIRYELLERRSMSKSMDMAAASPQRERDKALGVTVDAQYTVGEYDILILSAKESHGLETWLSENGYRTPTGASRVLESYLKQGLKFFVAKVNLTEHAKLGYSSLRPLQVAYESPKFMLPIRLGTLNADGQQELFIYFITRNGRVETTNYRTIKLPEGSELPIFIKEEFPSFYKDLFTRQVKNEQLRGIFMEYAWDMNWCDPCAANPLSADELRKLGVFWQGEPSKRSVGGGQDAFLTRLHVRYDAQHFPEDLVFQETSDRSNFQARYVLRHPWTGTDHCAAAQAYQTQLRERQEREAQTLAHLTGWGIADIRHKMKLDQVLPMAPKKWWEKLWGNE